MSRLTWFRFPARLFRRYSPDNCGACSYRVAMLHSASQEKSTMTSRFIQSLEQVPPDAQGCVLTMGNFDGMHVGHQRILHAARLLADETSSPVVAMTFDPPPDLVLRPDDKPQRITPHQQKCEILAEAGADMIVTARVDKSLLAMEAEEFIDNVIVGRFAPRQVVEGHNFFFGRRRSGTVETLQQAGPQKGFDVHLVAPVTLEIDGMNQRVSSTVVRGLVASGDVVTAAHCLGRPFKLYSNIVAGRGRGMELNFPTVNLTAGEQIVPADGVYAGRAEINGKNFIAAVSVGKNPTFGGTDHTVEAHLVDTEGDFYGQNIVLSFVELIRRQKAFDDSQSLKTQIEKDVNRVRETLG